MRMHLAPLWSAATGRSDAGSINGGVGPNHVHVVHKPVRITKQMLPLQPLVDQLRLAFKNITWHYQAAGDTTDVDNTLRNDDARACAAIAKGERCGQQQYHRHTCLPKAPGVSATACSCVRGTFCACGSARLSPARAPHLCDVACCVELESTEYGALIGHMVRSMRSGLHTHARPPHHDSES